jgi:hypothetical protein
MPFLIALFLLGHRLIAFATGSSIEVMFVYDYLAIVAIASIMTFLVDRRLWRVIAFNLLLLTLAIAQPAWAPRLWLLFSFGLPAVAAMSLLRHRDRLRGETSRSGTSWPGTTPRSASGTELR